MSESEIRRHDAEGGVVGLGEIRAYLDERRAAATRGLERGSAAGLLRRVSTYRSRQWIKVKGTTLLVPLSRQKARSLRQQTDIKLHLASGANRLPGWINIDILGMHPDLHWDLRRGIPFPDGTAHAVFLEHFLEHLTLADGLDILDECRRVLAPGGTIRVGVPDFGRYMRSYAGDGAFIEQLRPGRPTPLLAVGEVALAHGHRSVWDTPTLERVLEESGFVDVRGCRFGESTLEPPPDNPLREPESIYAEGTKPAA